MKLKAGVMDGLLAENRITRRELAKDFEIELHELNLVLDGKMEAGVELARLLIAAFGAGEMRQAIDWAANGNGADFYGVGVE